MKKRATAMTSNPDLLPDGVYEGIWGGSSILVNHKNRIYKFNSELIVKGINIKVAMEIIEGNITFEEYNN